MSGLASIVCLKVVPRPEEVQIDPVTLRLAREQARSVINPPDLHALEMALHLKDRYGGCVDLVAMGPPLFLEGLRVGLAMGADAAYLLSDRAFGGADTLATSYTLAAGIRKIGAFDLIFCGEESSDGATGQVPAGIAEWLDIPQVCYVTHIDYADRAEGLRARREIGGGFEDLLAPLPALLSVKARLNEPRFLDCDRLDALPDSAVTVWNAADLAVDLSMIGAAGSPTVVAGVRQAAKRDRRRERIDGCADEQARTLVERLRPCLVEALTASAPDA